MQIHQQIEIQLQSGIQLHMTVGLYNKTKANRNTATTTAAAKNNNNIKKVQTHIETEQTERATLRA